MSPETTVSKSKKVVAFSKATFIAMLVLSFFTTSFSVMLILGNQEKAAAKILDCTVPYGTCYKQKALDISTAQEADIGAIIEYCGAVDDSSVSIIRLCVEKELRHGIR